MLLFGQIVLFLIILIGLILVHEWGHFVVARRNGVKVEEFGIFFPPRVWSRKTKKGWLFSINLLPIGGFVRLKGESDSDLRPHTFGAASFKTKTKIMLAGIGMNLVVAFLLLIFLALIGMPQLVDNQFSVKSDSHIAKSEITAGYVAPDSPAAKAGLKQADELISIGAVNKQVTALKKAENLSAVTQKYAGQTVVFSYKHNDDLITKTIKLRDKATVLAAEKSGKHLGILGVAPAEFSLQRYTWSAPVVAAGTMVQFTGLTFQGIGTALVNLVQGNGHEASQQVSGPVGIFKVTQQGSMLGYQFVIMITAIISLSLAIMNILPIPALDGGKLFITAVARAFKRRLSQNSEAWLYGGSFIVLIGLLILITVVDVRRFF